MDSGLFWIKLSKQEEGKEEDIDFIEVGLTSCATTLIRMTLSRFIDLLFCPVVCHSAERHSSDCHGALTHAR
jgi:hypothetical protein